GQEVGIAIFRERPFLRGEVFAPRGPAMEPFRTREMNQGSSHGLEPERELLTILLRRQLLDPAQELAPSAEQNVIVFEKVHGSPLGSRVCVPSPATLTRRTTERPRRWTFRKDQVVNALRP